MAGKIKSPAEAPPSVEVVPALPAQGGSYVVNPQGELDRQQITEADLKPGSDNLEVSADESTTS